MFSLRISCWLFFLPYGVPFCPSKTCLYDADCSTETFIRSLWSMAIVGAFILGSTTWLDLIWLQSLEIISLQTCAHRDDKERIDHSVWFSGVVVLHSSNRSQSCMGGCSLSRPSQRVSTRSSSHAFPAPPARTAQSGGPIP